MKHQLERYEQLQDDCRADVQQVKTEAARDVTRFKEKWEELRTGHVTEVKEYDERCVLHSTDEISKHARACTTYPCRADTCLLLTRRCIVAYFRMRDLRDELFTVKDQKHNLETALASLRQDMHTQHCEVDEAQAEANAEIERLQQVIYQLVSQTSAWVVIVCCGVFVSQFAQLCSTHIRFTLGSSCHVRRSSCCIVCGVLQTESSQKLQLRAGKAVAAAAAQSVAVAEEATMKNHVRSCTGRAWRGSWRMADGRLAVQVVLLTELRLCTLSTFFYVGPRPSSRAAQSHHRRSQGKNAAETGIFHLSILACVAMHADGRMCIVGSSVALGVCRSCSWRRSD